MRVEICLGGTKVENYTGTILAASALSFCFQLKIDLRLQPLLNGFLLLNQDLQNSFSRNCWSDIGADVNSLDFYILYRLLYAAL